MLPKLQDLEVINFGDCLVRTGGAKALADALKEGHKKLKVCSSLGHFPLVSEPCIRSFRGQALKEGQKKLKVCSSR